MLTVMLGFLPFYAVGERVKKTLRSCFVSREARFASPRRRHQHVGAGGDGRHRQPGAKVELILRLVREDQVQSAHGFLW